MLKIRPLKTVILTDVFMGKNVISCPEKKENEKALKTEELRMK